MQSNFASWHQSGTNEIKTAKNKKKKGQSNDINRKENVDNSRNETTHEPAKTKKDKKKETKRAELTIDSINSNQSINQTNNVNHSKSRDSINSLYRDSDSITAPPGFSDVLQGALTNRVNPPPGFATQEANNLTFISSSGQAYNILPGSIYTSINSHVCLFLYSQTNKMIYTFRQLFLHTTK